jgi:hypothetical protein
MSPPVNELSAGVNEGWVWNLYIGAMIALSLLALPVAFAIVTILCGRRQPVAKAPGASVVAMTASDLVVPPEPTKPVPMWQAILSAAASKVPKAR